MTDLSQLERSSLTTLRIIVDLMAGEVVALRNEVKRMKAKGTQNPQPTPGECSTPRECSVPDSRFANEPVAWLVRGCEYDTGCEYQFVTLLKEQADAAAKQGGKVAPLHLHPQSVVAENATTTLTEAEREAIEKACDLADHAGFHSTTRATLRGLLERLG